MVFECITTDDIVIWQLGTVTRSFVASELNTSKSAGQFFFVLVDVNGSILVSTATIETARPNDDGTELGCMGNTQPVSRAVAVSGEFHCNQSHSHIIAIL